MKHFLSSVTSLRMLGAAGILVGIVASPAAGQTSVVRCEGLSGADRVACLRDVLASAQAELERAERDLGAEAATEATATGAATAPVQPAPSTAAPELGAEQVSRRARDRDPAPEAQRLLATIVSSERIHPNRLQVHLSDGQIWRQTQADTQIVELARNPSIEAEIWPSGLGGYRMRLPSVGRVLRVERVR